MKTETINLSMHGEILTLIEKEQANYLQSFEIISTVRQTLQAFEGKTISKRMATAVQKALPLHTVYYRAEYGMFHLMIWGNGIEYDKRLSILLGYDSEKTFFLNKVEGVTRGFDDFNAGWLMQKDRADSMEKLKAKIPEMVRLKKQYQEAKEAIEDICEYHSIETFYQLRALLHGDN